jgi:hypothetical protein
LLGYTTLHPDAVTDWAGCAIRRYFYIMLAELGRSPSEAIDPLTVRPGVLGEKTERCKQQPTPAQRAAIDAIMGAEQAKLDVRRAAARQRQQKHRQPVKERAQRNAKRRERYARKRA